MKKIYDKNNTFVAELKYEEIFFSNYSKHSHEMLSLTLVKEGELNIQYHLKKNKILKPKEIAVFNPHEVHQSKNISKNALGYYVLYLDLNWCIKIQNKLFDNNTFYPINTSIITDESTQFNFFKTCTNIMNSKSNYQELENLIYDIFKNYAKKEEKKKKNTLALEIHTYILNLEEDVCLDDIANDFDYSKEHLIRVFKKEFGLSPHAFILNRKVNKAKNELNKNGKLNLTNLAYEVGFYDQSHFSKNFKKIYAINPNTYKIIK